MKDSCLIFALIAMFSPLPGLNNQGHTLYQHHQKKWLWYWKLFSRFQGKAALGLSFAYRQSPPGRRKTYFSEVKNL
jgi:hypothetical protein